MDGRPISSSSSSPISSGESVRKEQTPPHHRITAETKDKAPMSEQQLVTNARDRETSPYRLHPSSTVASGSTLQSHRQRHSVDNVPVTEAGLQEVFDAATTNFERRLDQKFRHANDQFAATLKEVGTKLSSEIDTRTQTASARIQEITHAVERNTEKLKNVDQTIRGNIEMIEGETQTLKNITQTIRRNIKTIEGHTQTLKKTNQHLAEGNRKANDTLAKIEERQQARRAKREAKKADPKSEV